MEGSVGIFMEVVTLMLVNDNDWCGVDSPFMVMTKEME